MKTYTATISQDKLDEHSFLVALIPALSIPTDFLETDEVLISDCAVIAANHALDGKNKWAYVHLESAEKEVIGNALSEACAQLNQWYWCNLYSSGLSELEEYKQRLDALRELCGYVEDGSDTCVTIGQDDATKDWVLRIGNRKQTLTFSSSFYGMFDEARKLLVEEG